MINLKNFRYANLVLILLTLLSASSCKKEAQQPIQKTTPAHSTHMNKLSVSFPSSKNGHLAFSDDKEFNDYITLLQGSDIEDITALNSENGFISFYDFKQMNEDEARQKGINISKISNINPEDQIFNACLSPYKELQIGQNVYRIDSPFILQYTEGHESEIDEMYQAYRNGQFLVNEDSKLTRFSDYISVVKIPLNAMFKTQSAHSGSNVGIGHEEYVNTFAPDRRVHYNIWWQNWFFYKSCGAANETDAYRGWWIFRWWSNIAYGTKSIEWKAQVYYSYGGGTSLWFNDNGSLSSNSGIVQHTILFIAGVGNNMNIQGINAPFPSQELFHCQSVNRVNWSGQNLPPITLQWN